MILSVHPIATVFDKGTYFAAARDGLKSRDEDPDAREAGETFFPKATRYCSDVDPCACLTACIPASRSRSSKRRMKGFGQRLIVQRHVKQNVTIMETVSQMPVCPGMEEKEEADSQTMGVDLQGPVCEA